MSDAVGILVVLGIYFLTATGIAIGAAVHAVLSRHVRHLHFEAGERAGRKRGRDEGRRAGYLEGLADGRGMPRGGVYR